VRFALAMLAAALLASGCARRMDMYDQPKVKPLDATTFFADGRASREPPPGTIARGWLRDDRHLYTGMVDDTTLARTFPLPVTRALLERGRQRYAIYCTPCHDHVGSGRGMVVRRGFKQPPSFHQDRLRDAPVGYLFDVMTNGFGTMSGYASQVPVQDRWAIAAYIRALQLSQNVKVADLGPADRKALEKAARSAPPHGEMK
jgi:hypothetical protein